MAAGRSSDRTSDRSATWRAMALGIPGIVMTIAVMVGVAWLLVWTRVITDRQLLAALVIGGVVAGTARVSWLVTREMRVPRRWLIGGLAPLATVVMLLVVSWPIAAPMLDVHSVAVALGWTDAANLGTLPTRVLHRMNETAAESGAPGSAERAVIVAVASAVAILSIMVIAGTLAAMLAPPHGTTRSRVRVALAIVLVAGMSIGYLAWPSVWITSNALMDFDQSSGPEVGVNLSEVVNHPEAMWGERVVVSAEVHDVLGEHAAIIGNDADLVGDTLLILGNDELASTMLVRSGDGLSEGNVVQVSGTVQRYDPDRLASDLGVSLDDARQHGYDGRSVIVVDAIDPDIPAAAKDGDPEFSSGTTAGYDYGVTIDDIVNAPDAHVGLEVTVSGEIEETILTPHVFVLDDQGLLAISAEAHPELFVEATAYTTGTVGIFQLAEVERETGLDLDDTTLSSFNGQPYILVESVTLVR